MRTPFVACCALVALVCNCGGKEGSSSFNPTVPPDAASSESGTDSGTCLGSGHGPLASPPTDSRPSASTCSRTAYPQTPDAGPPASCDTDADCTSSAPPNSGLHCAEHVCGYDECLVDADCPSGQLCDCTPGGSWHQGASCVPAACHTSADCGPGNYCIPSRGYCGGVIGYDCTSNRDTCADPATDCAACGGNACVYSPVVGHFTCTTNGCNG